MNRKSLLARALTVRDEQVPAANSAPRVGQLLYDLILNALIGYDDQTEYAQGEYTFYQGVIWRATDDVPTGQVPAAGSDYWADDIARRPEEISEDAPDLLLSVRAVHGYIEQRLKEYTDNGQDVVLPAATESKAGVSKRASNSNLVKTNTLDHITPAQVLALLDEYAKAVTLDIALHAGNRGTVNIQADGGISAAEWLTSTDTKLVFVPKYVEGKGYCLAVAELTLPTTTPGGGTGGGGGTGTGGGTGGGGTTETLVWASGDLLELVDAPTGNTLVAPTELRVVRKAGTRNAVLSFRDNANDETGYRVWVKREDAADFVALIDLKTDENILPLSDLQMFQLYLFKVQALRKNAQGVEEASDFSNVFSITLIDYDVSFGIYGTGNPPPLIRTQTGGYDGESPGTGNLGVLITNPNGQPLTNADFDYVSLEVTGPNGEKYGWNYPDGHPQDTPYWASPRPDGAPLPGGEWREKLTIYKGVDPIQINELISTLGAAPVKPGKPTNVVAKRNSNNTGVTVTWDNVDDKETSFEVEILRGGVYSFLGSVAANVTTFTTLINPLADGTKFRVVAVGNVPSARTESDESALPSTGARITVLARIVRRIVDGTSWRFLQIKANGDKNEVLQFKAANAYGYIVNRPDTYVGGNANTSVGLYTLEQGISPFATLPDQVQLQINIRVQGVNDKEYGFGPIEYGAASDTYDWRTINAVN